MITVVGQSENAGRHINIWMRNLKRDATLINNAQAFTGCIRVQACQSAAVKRELKYCQHLKVPHMLKHVKKQNLSLTHFSPALKWNWIYIKAWMHIGPDWQFTHPVKFIYLISISFEIVKRSCWNSILFNINSVFTPVYKGKTF